MDEIKDEQTWKAIWILIALIADCGLYLIILMNVLEVLDKERKEQFVSTLGRLLVTIFLLITSTFWIYTLIKLIEILK